MTCDHGKLYSFKTQNILCAPVKLFITRCLFPQNSFKGLARTNDIVIYLRKSLVAKVYRSMKKNKRESCIWHTKKNDF